MRLFHKFAIGLGMLLTDIVFLCCCLYLTIIADRMEAVVPNYFLWIGLVIICFLVNLIFVKKRKLAALIAWNLIWMTLTAIVVSLSFQCAPASIPLKIFVCGVLIAIEGHSIALALLPQKASTQLTYLDILVAVFAIFLAGCHLKNLDDVISLQILGFICVGYALVALIFLRTYEDQVSIVKGENVVNRVKVFGLLALIVVISCIACGALTVAARNAGSGIIDIVLLMAQGIKKAFHSAGNALTALFSKIPNQFGDTGDVPFISSGETLAEETGAEAVARLPEWLFPLVGIIVAAIVIIAILCLIWKLRREKLQLDDRPFQKAEITTNKLTPAKPSWFRRLRDKLKLRLTMYLQRKTPEGLAVLIRKSGKSIGVEMLPEDSWHGYVLKFIPYGDADKLTEISNYLKIYFYSGKAQSLSSEQYQSFAACLKQLKKPDSQKSI